MKEHANQLHSPAKEVNNDLYGKILNAIPYNIENTIISDEHREFIASLIVKQFSPAISELPSEKKYLRVGRKQGRAVLDENGHELMIFPIGKEKEAQEYCDWINSKLTYPVGEEKEKKCEHHWVGKYEHHLYIIRCKKCLSIKD